MLTGIFPVLQTPFDDRGELDIGSVERETEFCIARRVDGLVVPANASEFFVLDDSERLELVHTVLRCTAKRVPVVVSVSGASERAALRFATHAADLGASALMAMPPYVRKAAEPSILRYYQGLTQFSLPVIIQNAPAPLGTPLRVEFLLSLVERLSCDVYIKEELQPSTHRTTTLTQQPSLSLRGVFGGADGRTMISELRRGAVGVMPAASIPEVHAAIFKAFRVGDHGVAGKLYEQLGLFFVYGQLYGVAWAKEVLRRRGVLQTAYIRDPQTASLDKADHAALDEYWPKLSDLIEESGRYLSLDEHDRAKEAR